MKYVELDSECQRLDMVINFEQYKWCTLDASDSKFLCLKEPKFKNMTLLVLFFSSNKG